MPAHPLSLGWWWRARCRSYPDPDDFHTDPTLPLPAAALACCAGCPITEACLDAGRGSSGLWGGLTEAARVIIYAAGWTLGQPVPPVRLTRQWVTLAEASAALGIARRRVRGWADSGRVDSTSAPLHYGQPTTLVDLDQCRAHLEAA